jgi:transcriptional regulator with XRE-family HTH domain
MSTREKTEGRRSPWNDAAVAQGLKALANTARSIRLGRGHTLEETAEMCDLDVRHVQLIESGNANPTVATLLRLARGLGVTLEALLERSSLAVQDVRAAALSDPNMTLTEVVEAYKPVMEIDALIAVRVKSLRLERDWSQSELAQRAGISQGAIQGIEARSKSPTLRTVDAIATAFSIPPHELLAPPARTTMPKARAGRK